MLKLDAISPKVQRWLRFIIGGGINTGFTYLVYICINKFTSYQIAYLFAYILGVIFSYWFNARFVFKTPLSWRGLLSYPLVYVLQYLMSAVLLGILIDFFETNESIAPLLITALMIPFTYLMSKIVLQWKSKN